MDSISYIYDVAIAPTRPRAWNGYSRFVVQESSLMAPVHYADTYCDAVVIAHKLAESIDDAVS